ncbi:hypothetical protein HPB51_005485 [Rhipicephalus microplus]|uniref:Uncharacterized protein n=1 Tax=Rhipicephalus microplus TaxID=6941 RepID=A0A9J6EY85_RHIMP|nr:hypothetical protein HPB51_005485 [Rhipicephalus microplus]
MDGEKKNKRYSHPLHDVVICLYSTVPVPGGRASCFHHGRTGQAVVEGSIVGFNDDRASQLVASIVETRRPENWTKRILRKRERGATWPSSERHLNTDASSPALPWNKIAPAHDHLTTRQASHPPRRSRVTARGRRHEAGKHATNEKHATDARSLKPRPACRYQLARPRFFEELAASANALARLSVILFLVFLPRDPTRRLRREEKLHKSRHSSSFSAPLTPRPCGSFLADDDEVAERSSQHRLSSPRRVGFLQDTHHARTPHHNG